MDLEHTLLTSHRAALAEERQRRETAEAELQRSAGRGASPARAARGPGRTGAGRGASAGADARGERGRDHAPRGRLVDDSAKTREQLEAEHAMERLRVQQALADEHQAALQQKNNEARQRIDELKQTLQGALAESQRLEMLIEKEQADRRKLVVRSRRRACRRRTRARRSGRAVRSHCAGARRAARRAADQRRPHAPPGADRGRRAAGAGRSRGSCRTCLPRSTIGRVASTAARRVRHPECRPRHHRSRPARRGSRCVARASGDADAGREARGRPHARGERQPPARRSETKRSL